MRQRGGFLEPVQPVPAFHYTQSAARKAWTSMVYPYAPYFFNLLREIPWSTWEYKDDDVHVQFNNTPYAIIGGAECELLDAAYGNELAADVRLHANTDPTGDIDVLIPSIRIIPSKKKKRTYNLFQADHITMEPYTRTMTLWMLDHIEAYFKKLSYNFAEWFPTAVEFDLANDPEGQFADRETVRVVGPFYIYLSVKPPEEDSDGSPTLAIQVLMGYKLTPESEEIHTQHMIEFLLTWFPPVTFNDTYPAIVLPSGLIISRPASEIQRNVTAISTRIQFLSNPELVHKIRNHFGRAIFLVNVIELPALYNPAYTNQISGLYLQTIRAAAEHELSHEDALLMLLKCPERLKTTDQYPDYKKLCVDTLHLTLAECGIPVRNVAPVAAQPSVAASRRSARMAKRGGARRTPRPRRCTSKRRTRFSTRS